MASLPIIRIKYAYLLRENASLPLHELWGKGTEPADDAWLEARVKSYQKAWQQYEQTILEGITGLLGISFRQNIIDVYIAPWFNAFSDPLVIGVTQEPDTFVDILTHELTHRLLTDNTTFPEDKMLVPIWEKLFGKTHSFNTLIHIPVFAVLEAVYTDLLKEPSRLKRDKAAAEQSEEVHYKDAWEYVEKTGYKEIIGKLKVSYGH